MENTVFHQPLFDRIPSEKRERILGAAIEEFAREGFANANTNRIAGESGISVGSLFKYFSSKEDLYLTLVNLALARLEESLLPVLESGLGTLEKIRAIIDLLFERTAANEALTRLYNRFTVEGERELAMKIASRIETLTSTAYANLIEQGKTEGILDAGADVRVFAFCMDNVFLGAQFSLASEYYRDRMEIYLGAPVDDRRNAVKEQLYRFIKNALTGGRK